MEDRMITESMLNKSLNSLELKLELKLNEAFDKFTIKLFNLLEPRFQSIETRLDRIEETLKVHEGHFEHLFSKLETLNQEYIVANAQMKRMEESLRFLQTKMNSMDGKMNFMEEKMDSMEGKINSIQSQMHSMQTEVHSMQATFVTKEEFRAAIYDLKFKVDSLQKQIDELERRLSIH